MKITTEPTVDTLGDHGNCWNGDLACKQEAQRPDNHRARKMAGADVNNELYLFARGWRSASVWWTNDSNCPAISTAGENRPGKGRACCWYN